MTFLARMLASYVTKPDAKWDDAPPALGIIVHYRPGFLDFAATPEPLQVNWPIRRIPA